MATAVVIGTTGIMGATEITAIMVITRVTGVIAATGVVATGMAGAGAKPLRGNARSQRSRLSTGM